MPASDPLRQPPEIVSIYHITHVHNLPGIIAADGLWCDSLSRTHGKPLVETANNEIKRRRKTTVVPVSPGGSVADYVPFYFAPRSPMLFAIHHASGVDYGGGQGPMVYLVSNLSEITKHNLRFCFTDGHAIMTQFTRFYTSLDDLNRIDWNLMQARMWNRTANDPDRQRRRQAEFLVDRFFPWTAITEIGVLSLDIQKEVLKLISVMEHRPKVLLRKKWYY